MWKNRKLLNQLSRKSRCNLVAICDNSNQKLDSTNIYLKEVFNKNKIKDFLKILEFKDLLIAHQQSDYIDLLVICTPSGAFGKNYLGCKFWYKCLH